MPTPCDSVRAVRVTLFLATFFAVAACSLIMLGRLQKDTITLRWFLLAATPFGIGYDVSVGAVVALAGSVLSAFIAAWMLSREIHFRHDVEEFMATHFMGWRFEGVHLSLSDR